MFPSSVAFSDSFPPRGSHSSLLLGEKVVRRTG